MQDAGAAIQVDLSTPVDLAPGGSIPGSSWGAGIGAKPGMPTLRSGTLWSDLINIRPIHAPGVFTAHDEDILFTGLLSVAAVTGSFAEVTAEMGTTSGGGWFYGRLFYMIGPNYVSGHGGPPPDTTIDPLTHFTPLTLIAGGIAAVPEPGTCLLGGIGAVTLVFIARKRPRR